MNELVVAIGLSHCGQRTTAEAIESFTKPVLVTHAGCYAVHSHPRNREDRELRAMAERGGVVGMYFMPYLVTSPISPTHENAMLSCCPFPTGHTVAVAPQRRRSGAKPYAAQRSGGGATSSFDLLKRALFHNALNRRDYMFAVVGFIIQ